MNEMDSEPSSSFTEYVRVNLLPLTFSALSGAYEDEMAACVSMYSFTSFVVPSSMAEAGLGLSARFVQELYVTFAGL